MPRFAGLALLVIGVILLVMGLQADDSIASHISKFFTGAPTDRTVWLLLGGVAALVTGGCLTFLPAKAAAR